VYKVPSDIERHADAWATAAKRVQSLTGIKPDNGNDVARLCFASHDPEAYHNPQAVELEIETTPTLEKEKPTLSLQVTAPTALQGLSDSELIEKASNAANGSKFTSLWHGLWQDECTNHKTRQMPAYLAYFIFGQAATRREAFPCLRNPG
tara:strand:+ start:221 stop:670 length:450 start_codon:yes stop_codon:yes gene_type:complete